MSGRRKRLAADLPQHWLHDPAYWTLTDRAWRLHTHGLMWAIGRTDGHIPQDMLSMLLPGSDADREIAVKDLEAAGRWKRVTGGWLITGWEQSQSTVAEIENNRRREREKKRRQRASPDSAVPPGTPPGESTRGVRNGTARDGTDREAQSGTDDEPDTGWPEVECCTGCGGPLDPALVCAGITVHPNCEEER